MESTSAAVPLRILLADDNVRFVKVLRSVLTGHGYGCSMVHSVAAAIQAIESNTYDVIVVDLHIGAQTGLTVLRRAFEIEPSARRILISGSPLGDLSSLADVHLAKPFERDVLLRAVAAPRRPRLPFD